MAAMTWAMRVTLSSPTTKSTVYFVVGKGPLNGGIGAARMTLEGRHGPYLPGLPRHHALRRTRRRGDDAVFHAEVRQRGQPHPRLRQGGRPGLRGRAGADRGAHPR